VIYLLYTVHILVCLFLIMVVLLQQGKGADLSVFGGGSTQAAFGSRGATTFLHKLTVVSFVVFVLTTLAIGIPQFAGTSSVLKGADKTTTGTKAPAKAPAATPGKAPAATPANRGNAAAPAATPAAPAAATPPPASSPAPATPAAKPPAAPAPAPGH
jgi:preprotein translocase subunit SecG